MSEDLPGADDPDRTFRRVVESSESWIDDRDHGSSGTVSRSLGRSLNRSLNADADSEWERDVIEYPTGRQTASVVVNGAIGVEVLGSLSAHSVAGVLQNLTALARRYTHLLLIGYRLPPSETDRWRLLRRSITPQQLDVDRLEIRQVGRSRREDEPESSILSRGIRATVQGLPIVVGTLLLFLALEAIWAWLVGAGPLIQTFVAGFGVLYLLVLGLVFASR